MKRDKKGRYLRSKPSVWRRKQIKTDHLYCVNQENETTDSDECEPWKTGRRLVEWEVLLTNLRYCQKCRLGPVPLTYYSVKGELQKGLGGYLYVQCGNHDCGYINRAAYGKTYCEPSKQGRQGMPCFAVNTKLGTAMIDSLGGPKRVNNMLATLNMKPISDANLKLMEKRAGDVVEKVSEESTRIAADEAFRNEMEKIATQESLAAQANMSGLIEDLGVCPLPDASPAVNLRLEDIPEDDWTDDDDDNGTDNHVTETECVPEVSGSMSIDNSSTPTDVRYPLPPPHCTQSTDRTSNRPGRKSKVRLLTKYPCSTRSGMSVALDTAWHKKGFDSLTSHTFFMTTDKSSQRKKVVKTIVGHRTCGVCSWWRRKRPGQKVRPHRCVRNHTGSARAMEATSGVKGVRELFEEGTPIEYLEGDGDSTLISKIKTELNVTMKKRFDKNHVVKNFTKKLYILRSEKGIKLSKNIISHLEKCLKYTFAKNQGDQDGMEKNLKAIVPHQFGDHSLCCARFCGYKRRPGEKYIHRSLPYKTPLHDENLRQRLQEMFNPLIFNAHQYIDLGSSQQCEHANKEVTLRAPKSHHYGNSSSLDYRVHATAAFVNEGRHYISKTVQSISCSCSNSCLSFTR